MTCECCRSEATGDEKCRRTAKDVRLLRHVRDAPPHARTAAAARTLRQPQQRRQERRLPRARGAHNYHQRALLGLEVDVGKDRLLIRPPLDGARKGGGRLVGGGSRQLWLYGLLFGDEVPLQDMRLWLLRKVRRSALCLARRMSQRMALHMTRPLVQCAPSQRLQTSYTPKHHQARPRACSGKVLRSKQGSVEAIP